MEMRYGSVGSSIGSFGNRFRGSVTSPVTLTNSIASSHGNAALLQSGNGRRVD